MLVVASIFPPAVTEAVIVKLAPWFAEFEEGSAVNAWTSITFTVILLGDVSVTLSIWMLLKLFHRFRLQL